MTVCARLCNDISGAGGFPEPVSLSEESRTMPASFVMVLEFLSTTSDRHALLVFEWPR